MFTYIFELEDEINVPFFTSGLSRGIEGFPRGAMLPVRRDRLPGETLQVAALLRRSEEKSSGSFALNVLKNPAI